MDDMTAAQQVESDAPARHRRLSQAGQALLELALVLPILCLLVVGIADLGRAAAVTIAVNNAATVGAEYGSQNPATAADINSMQNYATDDTHGNNIPAGMTATATYGCLCDMTGSGVSCTYPVPAQTTCSNILSSCTGQPVECVQVVTQLSYSSFLNYPGVPLSYQANGHAVMRVGN
jgi:Flp pilus assembly protein TadG